MAALPTVLEGFGAVGSCNQVAKLPAIIDSVQCPRCNGESKVIDSRDGEVARRRRRECLRCKNRYSTYGIHADEYSRLQTTKVDIRQINDAIVALLAIKSQFGGSNG